MKIIYRHIGADGVALEETTDTGKTIYTRWSKDRRVRYRITGNVIELPRPAARRKSRPAFPCKVLEFPAPRKVKRARKGSRPIADPRSH